MCGETEIEASKLRETYEEMSRMFPLLLPKEEGDLDGEMVEDGETSGFEQQFLVSKNPP